MNILKTNIHIENISPFTILHLSDTHLCLADERNDEKKIKLAKSRTESFPQAEQMIKHIEEFNKESRHTIVHTGDLIDFVSFANLDAAKEFTDKNDVFMAAGNHEFSLYVGETFEDTAYRNQSLDLVQQAFKNNIRYSSRIINGVNFVAIDNSYYLFDEKQLNFLKEQTERPFPVILLLHTPLYTESLYTHMMNNLHNSCAYLMNVPTEKMTMYSDHRLRQQTADTTTTQAYDLIINCSEIKAILTGHLHFDYEDKITDTLTQYVTDCTTIRIVTFK
ncbi:MAG: metallophosphoesterase [Ruminococcaceae bacterium]|nr:metallophosphoesterase [Oscillospiraceae bacterium]